MRSWPTVTREAEVPRQETRRARPGAGAVGSVAAGEEKAAVRYVRHPLDGDEISGEIKAHLASGKMPTKLALTWDDRISFVLGEKMEIKRLAFLDLLKEQAEKDAEHADEQFDADFALMTGEFARFLPQLVEALGGEVVEGQ